MALSNKQLVEFSKFAIDHSNPLQSEWRKDRALLELAKFATMENGGRAQEYLNHYLEGSGTPKYFKASDLLSEDPNVAQVLASAVSLEAAKAPLKPGQTGIVGLRQRDISVLDWKLALGSFPLKWTYIATRATNGVTLLELTVKGSNEYKWHPDDSKRDTQVLHQAAARLQKPKTNLLDVLQNTKPAKDFWMFATESRYFVPLKSILVS